jgi:hypothetical protein
MPEKVCGLPGLFAALPAATALLLLPVTLFAPFAHLAQCHPRSCGVTEPSQRTKLSFIPFPFGFLPLPPCQEAFFFFVFFLSSFKSVCEAQQILNASVYS